MRLRATVRPTVGAPCPFGKARFMSPAIDNASAFGKFADVRFSNRPVGVKRFRLSTTAAVDVTGGLALLYGMGTSALPSWDPRMGWSNLMGGLAGSGRVMRADLQGPSNRRHRHHAESVAALERGGLEL